MPYFFYKLLGPRPTFPADITEQEKQLMQEHAAYWWGFVEKRKAIVLGPIMDPKGTFGMGVFEVESAEELNAAIEGDPVTKSGLGFRHKVHPMPRIMARK